MTIEKAAKLPDTPRVRKVPVITGYNPTVVEYHEITEPSEYEAFKKETEEAIKKLKAFKVSKLKYSVTRAKKIKSPTNEDLEYFEKDVFPFEPILDYEKSKLGGQSIGDTYYEYKKNIEFYAGEIENTQRLMDDKKNIIPKKELQEVISESTKALKKVITLYNKFLTNHFDNIKEETLKLLEESISDENLQVLEPSAEEEEEEEEEEVEEVEEPTKVFQVLFPNESESFYSEFMEALKKLKNYGEYGNLLLMLNKTANLEVIRSKGSKSSPVEILRDYDSDETEVAILTDPKTRREVIEPILSSLDKLKQQVNDTYFAKKKRISDDPRMKPNTKEADSKLKEAKETHKKDSSNVIKLTSYFIDLRDEMDSTKAGKKKNSIRESTMKHHRDLLSRLDRYLQKMETNKPADIYKVLTAGNAKTKGDVLKIVSFLKIVKDNPYKIAEYDYSPKDGLTGFKSREKAKIQDDSIQRTYTKLFNNYDALINLGEQIQDILGTELEGWFYDEEKTAMYGKVTTEQMKQKKGKKLPEDYVSVYDSLKDNPVNEEKVKLLDIILRDVKVQGEVLLLGKEEAEQIRQSMLNIEEILQRQFEELEQDRAEKKRKKESEQE